MTAEATVLSAYVASHPDDAARVCEMLEPGSAAAALASVNPVGAANVLRAMAPSPAAALLAAFPAAARAEVVAALPIEMLTNLLRRLEAPDVERVLQGASRAQADGAARLLACPDGTAGSLMDPLAPAVTRDVTVGELRRLVPHTARHDEIWIVDDAHVLIGAVDRDNLARAADSDVVRTLMRPFASSVPIHLPADVLATLPEWEQVDALPVVDAGHRLVGLVRHRQVRQAQARQRSGAGADRTVRTLMALGEVYWLGLSGLMQGLATTAASQGATRHSGGQP